MKSAHYPVVFWRTASGYSADVPALSGCVATGETLEHARQEIAEAIEMHLCMMQRSGESIPPPKSPDEDITDEVIESIEVILPEASPASVKEAVALAESVLPGAGEDDKARWPAVIAVCDFIESNPEEVWSFVARWGDHEDEDLRDAIACCGLEHLLEHHFDLIFPRVESLARTNPLFADMFASCWKFGQSERAVNAQRFDVLRTELGFGPSLA